MRIFGPGQIGQQADVAARFARRLAHQLDASALRFARAVREIDARHIEAGLDHAGHHLADRRWPVPSVATILVLRSVSIVAYCSVCALRPRDAARASAARCSSTATAGRVLPSTNSRNAPPPVEI